MSPYLFAQAVSVPLGLPERAVDAAECILVDCLELETIAQEQEIAPAALRQAINIILRQCYRIIALQLPKASEMAERPAGTAAAPAHSRACAC